MSFLSKKVLVKDDEFDSFIGMCGGEKVFHEYLKTLNNFKILYLELNKKLNKYHHNINTAKMKEIRNLKEQLEYHYFGWIKGNNFLFNSKYGLISLNDVDVKLNGNDLWLIASSVTCDKIPVFEKEFVMKKIEFNKLVLECSKLISL